MRRRRSLLLAGGWWRGAPPTPGTDGAHTTLPRWGCSTCLSQHITCGRCPPGNVSIGAPPQRAPRVPAYHRPHWLATHPGLRCTPNALRAFLPPPTLAYHPHRWPPADTGHLPCPSATPLATCGNRTWHAVAIARRAFRAPEALSFVSRGLVARSASYPRNRRHPHTLPRRGCPTCLSQHIACGRYPPGNVSIGVPTGGSTRSAAATPG